MSKPCYLPAFIYFIFSLQVPSVNGQIINLPYREGFENSFVLSPAGCTNLDCLIEFLPAWFANEAHANSRIYPDTNAKSGVVALGMIPITSFSPEIILKLAPGSPEALSVDFYATGYKNGGDKDTRTSILYVSVSMDGGLSFGSETEIDTFRNERQLDYRPYHFEFIPQTMSVNDVRVKWRAIRSGSGAGQAAKIFLDEVEVKTNVLSGTAAASKEEDVSIEKKVGNFIYFNKSTTGQLYHISGIMEFSIQDDSCIDTTSLPKGMYVFITRLGGKIKIMVD
jgi:hypothetical protein